jgi:oxygen-independent coproporphyrinogen III oxidase
MKDAGIYIHIPFCKQKCSYCDFLSFGCSGADVEDYIKALITEIELYKDLLQTVKVKSIFIGGGTPSMIDSIYISRIMDKLLSITSLGDEAEISIEANPGTLDKNKLAGYKNSLINRISMGLQSTHNHLLEKIGRIHSYDEFLQSYNNIRNNGFENINIDLMFALPDQTTAEWEDTLNSVVGLNPEHISCYSLKIEEGTVFHTLYNEDKLSLPGEDEDRRMYHYAIEFLQSKGYEHYEISNFAKPKKQSVHNKIYWHNQEYFGFGLGSHSNIDDKRYSNMTNIGKYLEVLSSGKKPIEEVIEISREERMFETMILGLRLMEGIEGNKFREKYGQYPWEVYQKPIEELIEQKLLIKNRNFLRLTPKGIDLSNYVFGKL